VTRWHSAVVDIADHAADQKYWCTDASCTTTRYVGGYGQGNNNCFADFTQMWAAISEDLLRASVVQLGTDLRIDCPCGAPESGC
jgi:hypothetical protein